MNASILRLLAASAIGTASPDLFALGTSNVTGAAEREGFWLVVVPVSAGMLLSLAMLFSWRTFAALCIALAVGTVLAVLAFSAVGLFSVLFIPWVYCLSVLVALIVAAATDPTPIPPLASTESSDQSDRDPKNEVPRLRHPGRY